MAMFKKKESFKIGESKILNLINEGCKVEGDVISDSFIRIDGHVEGNMSVEEGAIIGDKGLVKGNIKTRSLIIYGAVDGNIDSESLEIKNSGSVNGDIRTARLHIEFGGVYNGSLTMEKEGLLLTS
jgi:cytoskeletal protein CcmA (bactofilin family)